MRESIKRRLITKRETDRTTGCWNWTGWTDGKGYGRISVGPSRRPDGTRCNSMRFVHRAALFAYRGFDLDSDLHVLHRCDNPPCFNPEHLFTGTNTDNVRDMDRKGRRVTTVKRGEEHANAILSDEQVSEIFRLLDTDITQVRIAELFGVSPATINAIKHGRLRAHMRGNQ